MTVVTDVVERPASRVVLVIRLLWGSAAIEGLILALDLWSPIVSLGDWIHRGAMMLTIFWLIGTAYGVSRRMNRARVAFVFILLLGLNPSRLFLPSATDVAFLRVLVLFIACTAIGAQFLTFALMFTRPVSAWFKSASSYQATQPWKPGIEGEPSVGADHTANY